MEAFRELAITVSGVSPDVIADDLTNAAVPPWSRDVLAEDRICAVAAPGWVPRCFRRGEGDGMPSAELWLLLKNHERLELANIVPLSQGELSRSEYNAVLRDFLARVVEPVKTKLAGRMQIEVTSAEYRLSEHLPPDVYQKLEAFAISANRTTGSSHPSDQERWLEFLTAAYRQRCLVDPSVLLRWFHEEMHWPEDASLKLAGEYEFARGLLTAFENAA